MPVKTNYTPEQISEKDSYFFEKLKNIEKLIAQRLSIDQAPIPEDIHEVIKDIFDFNYDNKNTKKCRTYFELKNLIIASSILGSNSFELQPALLNKGQDQSEQLSIKYFYSIAKEVIEMLLLNLKRKNNELHKEVMENKNIDPLAIFEQFEASNFFDPNLLYERFSTTEDITQIVKIFYSTPDRLKYLLDTIYSLNEKELYLNSILNIFLKEIGEKGISPEKYSLYCLTTFLIAHNYTPSQLLQPNLCDETNPPASIFDLIDIINPELLSSETEFLEIKNIKDNIKVLKDISNSKNLIAKLFSIKINKFVEIDLKGKSILLKFHIGQNGAKIEQPIELSIPNECWDVIKEIITKSSPLFTEFGDYEVKTITEDQKKYIQISFAENDAAEILKQIHGNGTKVSQLFKPSTQNNFSKILIEYDKVLKALQSLPVAFIKQKN